MPFVKLDCGILNSTLWFEREAREVFLTALLMAEPFELTEPTEQIEVDSLESTGWMVPAGWYGFVPAAGVGIIHRAKVEEQAGRVALKQLGSPEESSRSKEFDGRRLVRVNGGYIVLNYFKYRDRDYTAAERMRRLRARKKAKTVTGNDDTLPRNVTQADSREQKADITENREQSATTNAHALTVNPHHKPTNLINGAEQRRHAQHGWCDRRRGQCVPAGLHIEIQTRTGKTHNELAAFYADALANWTAPLPSDVFKFWNRLVDEWTGASLPAVAGASTSKTGSGMAAVRRMAAKLEGR